MVYFIPTPIGNLDDISHRSLELLMRISHIFCEDTRITKKLLSLISEQYQLKLEPKTFISLHSHNEDEVLANLDASSLKQNDYAFVSDAGMPSISDPGAKLVKFCQENGVKYEVYAGANALLLAYASSGFLETSFSFFGFLPHKGKQREAKLLNVLQSPQNAVLYESPHRIKKLFEQIVKLDATRQIFAIKEATKKFERKFFGTAKEILSTLDDTNIKGEWVVVIKAKQTKVQNSSLTLDDLLELDLKPKQKAKLLARFTGESANEWYEKLISG